MDNKHQHDIAAYQRGLLEAICRLSIALAKSGANGQRELQKIRKQYVESIFHEVGEGNLRHDLEILSSTLQHLSLLKSSELDLWERSYNGRAQQGTRGRAHELKNKKA